MTNQSDPSKKDDMRIAFRLARSGEKEQARIILARALKENPEDPQAWAVMSEVVDTHQQAIDCLYRVLKFSNDLAVVRWATEQLDQHKDALRREEAGQAEQPAEPPATPPFGTSLPFKSERLPTPPPMMRPDFLHSTDPEKLKENGVEEVIVGSSSPTSDDSGEDAPIPSKRSSFSFLDADDDPITQTLESPFKQEPLPEDDWLEWDDQTVQLDKPALPSGAVDPNDTGKLPAYQPQEEEPETGEIPRVEPTTDSFELPPTKPKPPSLSDQPLVKSFATGNQELIPGFETPLIQQPPSEELSFEFDDEPQPEPAPKKRGGCLRTAFVVASLFLIAFVVGGAFLMINGTLTPPAQLSAALPFLASDVVEVQPTPTEADPAPQVEAEPPTEAEEEETPTEAPTSEPIPTVTPTPGPVQETTGLTLLEFTADLRASLSDVEDNPAEIRSISNAESGRVALASQQGVYVFEEGGAPFVLNELGASQVALSPADDNLLVSNDGVDLVVWDAGTTEATARLTAHSSPVTALEFSPNGRYLFSGSQDGTVIVWDATDLSLNRIVQRFRPANNPVQLAGWLGDSERYLLITENIETDSAILGIYDVTPEPAEDGQANDNGEVRTIEVPLGVTALAVSPTRPSGTQVAYGTENGLIQTINVETGSVRTLFAEPNVDEPTDEEAIAPETVVSLDFSTTGLLAASFGDDSIALWSGERFAPVGGIDQIVTGIEDLLWQVNGRSLLAVSGTDVYLYDFADLQIAPPSDEVGIGPGTLAPEVLFELEAAEGALAIKYSPDKRFVSLGLPNDRIIQYSIDPTAETAGTSTLQTQGPLLGSLEDVAFSPDSQLIAAALANGTIVVWSIEAGEVITTLTGLGDAITEVAFSNSGTLVAAGAIDGDAAIWDITPPAGLDAPAETLNPSVSLEDGHRDVFTAIEWAPGDELIATSSSDDAVVLWDATTGTIINKLRGHELGVGSFTWNDDGTRLAASVGANSAIFVWDIAAQEPLVVLEGHLDTPVSLAFRPGEPTLLSAGSNGAIFLWQYETSEYVSLSPDGGSPPATDTAFAPDGSGFTVSFEDGSARVWRLNDPE